jgi:Na+/phosphate symporter
MGASIVVLKYHGWECFRCVLLGVSIAVLKHYDKKQLGEERVCFYFIFVGHHLRKALDKTSR